MSNLLNKAAINSGVDLEDLDQTSDFPPEMQSAQPEQEPQAETEAELLAEMAISKAMAIPTQEEEAQAQEQLKPAEPATDRYNRKPLQEVPPSPAPVLKKSGSVSAAELRAMLAELTEQVQAAEAQEIAAAEREAQAAAEAAKNAPATTAALEQLRTELLAAIPQPAEQQQDWTDAMREFRQQLELQDGWIAELQEQIAQLTPARQTDAEGLQKLMDRCASLEAQAADQAAMQRQLTAAEAEIGRLQDAVAKMAPMLAAWKKHNPQPQPASNWN